jgi:hypothetical protein
MWRCLARLVELLLVRMAVKSAVAVSDSDARLYLDAERGHFVSTERCGPYRSVKLTPCSIATICCMVPCPRRHPWSGYTSYSCAR